MMTESDHDLIIKIQTGDRMAFAALVQKHHQKFYYLAYRYMQNKEDAQDVVQELFLRLWEKPYMFNLDKKIKFTTWFYRVVINFCLDCRKKKRVIIEDYEVADHDRSVEEQMLLQKKYDVMQEHMAQLPKRQKTALILCFLEELSHKEAAQIMGVSIKALQSLLMRAKATLKEKVS